LNTIDPTIGMTDSERNLFRLRSLHRERVEAIHKNECHVKLKDSTRLIVHLMPEGACLAPKSFTAAQLKQVSTSIRLLGERHGSSYSNSRFNADGLLLLDGYESIRSYSQLHRNGCYEGVMADAVFTDKGQTKILRENWCEEALLAALAGYLPFAKALGLEPPFWMFAALSGCEGARIWLNRSWQELAEHAIDRSIDWLPEKKLDAFDADPVQHLRPMIDVLWNTAGLERSFNYDDQGNRKPRQ
jgi:hypothetical protein